MGAARTESRERDRRGQGRETGVTRKTHVGLCDGRGHGRREGGVVLVVWEGWKGWTIESQDPVLPTELRASVRL